MDFEKHIRYDKTEDLIPIYQFLKDETEKTWEKTLAIADGKKPARKSLSYYTHRTKRNI